MFRVPFWPQLGSRMSYLGTLPHIGPLPSGRNGHPDAGRRGPSAPHDCPICGGVLQSHDRVG
eukprot:11622354-Alexandrium_andersonii.AAC.1